MTTVKKYANDSNHEESSHLLLLWQGAVVLNGEKHRQRTSEEGCSPYAPEDVLCVMWCSVWCGVVWCGVV